MTTNRRHIIRLAFILLIAVAGTAPTVFAGDELGNVRLFVGRSVVVNTDWPIARVSLTSADIADAVVTLPNQVLIQGKVPGTISMFLWDRGGVMRRYEVMVERDLTQLSDRVRELFPGERIDVSSSGKSIVLSGTATSKHIADKAVEVAAGYVEKKEDVVTLIQVREGPPAQVLLRVRFAEVSRSALTELGASLFTGPKTYKDWDARTTTEQFPAPDWGENGDKLVFSDFLNLFIYNTKHQLGAVIRALQSKGLFQSLAEPNLVAESGKEASFLAGGEFPVPIAQAGSTALSISVMFKEFGVRLNFTPTVVAGDRVRLKVRPEVSTLDFSNAVVLQGFRIPALTTRRTETELELQNGQTFAIAGLLNNTATQTLQKVPGIGDIPILGLLFRSKAAQKNRSELVVMITPEILRPGSPGVTNEIPRLQEQYLPPIAPDKAKPNPDPAFVNPGWGEPEKGMPARPKPAAAAAAAAPTAAPARANDARLTPAEAAAVLSSQDPKAPRLMNPAAAATPEPAATIPTPTAPATAQAAPSPTPTTPAYGNEAARPSKAERKQQEAERRAAEEQAKRDAKQAAEEQRRLEKQQKEQEQAAREQAKRDAEAAKKAARDAARQAEIDKKRQKAVDEAAARLKEAEAAYQAELAKKSQS